MWLAVENHTDTQGITRGSEPNIILAIYYQVINALQLSARYFVDHYPMLNIREPHDITSFHICMPEVGP